MEGCVSGGRDNKLLGGVGTSVCQFLVMPCKVKQTGHKQWSRTLN